MGNTRCLQKAKIKDRNGWRRSLRVDDWRVRPCVIGACACVCRHLGAVAISIERGEKRDSKKKTWYKRKGKEREKKEGEREGERESERAPVGMTTVPSQSRANKKTYWVQLRIFGQTCTLAVI